MRRQQKLKGLAFDIVDLLAIQSWAKRHELRMGIRLDHGVEDEEYEEVIALHAGTTGCFLLMWRDQNTVFAQPMPGRQLHFSSVSAALSGLDVKPGLPAAP